MVFQLEIKLFTVRTQQKHWKILERMKFWKHRRLEWNRNLKKRKNFFNKLYRCENLLDLYGTYLQEEPCYIPKMFRNDKVEVGKVRERKIIENSNLQKF